MRTLPLSSGSSPLMRGKDADGDSLVRCGGIIPAHAGKRVPERGQHRSKRDHPRSCGEKNLRWYRAMQKRGSSPLMREKVLWPVSICWGMRIIPAHAGKRITIKRYCCSGRDHPRSCGEKSRMRLHSCLLAGSSPLMRGKVAAVRELSPVAGIIPAHAGKRHSALAPRTRAQDHPRSCGEKYAHTPQLFLVAGSSPLMRGKDAGICPVSVVNGIIPAHAGKRLALSVE